MPEPRFRVQFMGCEGWCDSYGYPQQSAKAIVELITNLEAVNAMPRHPDYRVRQLDTEPMRTWTLPSFASHHGWVLQWRNEDDEFGPWARSGRLFGSLDYVISECRLFAPEAFSPNYLYRIFNSVNGDVRASWLGRNWMPDYGHQTITSPVEDYNPQEQENQEIMPPTPSSSTPPPALGESAMAVVGITREKGSNRLLLTVNAKPLHDLLDSIGVRSDATRFLDGPHEDYSVASQNRLSSAVLLRKQYPATFNLQGVFSQPPTIAKLRAIAESANEQIRRVLEHYQPIDIVVQINKRVITDGLSGKKG